MTTLADATHYFGPHHERIEQGFMTPATRNELLDLHLNSPDWAIHAYGASNLGVYTPEKTRWLIARGVRMDERAYVLIGIVADSDSPGAMGKLMKNAMIYTSPLAAVTVYKDYRVLPVGESAFASALIEKYALEAQRKLTIVTPNEHIILPKGYEYVEVPVTETRYAITPDTFDPNFIEGGIEVANLTAEYEAGKYTIIDEIESLFNKGDDAQNTVFDPNRITKGKLPYFGIREEGQLVAVTGSHGLIPDRGIALIGDVYTAPPFRQRGYATQTSATLLQYFFDHGFTRIVADIQNEKRWNKTAQRQLGFFPVAPIYYHTVQPKQQKIAIHQNDGAITG